MEVGDLQSDLLSLLGRSAISNRCHCSAVPPGGCRHRWRRLQRAMAAAGFEALLITADQTAACVIQR